MRLRLLLLLVVLFLGANARAATFTVNSTFPGSGDGICDAAGSGDGCTLGEAFAAAKASAGADTIAFDSGVFATPKSILVAPTLVFDSDITLAGPGRNLLSLESGTTGSLTLFAVKSGATANMSGLTIKGGVNGISNSGKLAVADCVFLFNTNAGIGSYDGTTTVTNCVIGNGKIGIDNQKGNVTVSDCFLNDNSRSGIVNLGTLTANNCSLNGNAQSAITNSGNLTANHCTVSDANGIGLLNMQGQSSSPATMSAINCTINGNKGAGIKNSGNMTATDCTVSGNSGSGIENSGAMTATNCTVYNQNSGNGIVTLPNNNGTNSTLKTINCTVSGNSTGILVNANVIATNCTVSGNSTYGIRRVAGAVLLKNTLVVGNATNTQGTVLDGGHNLLSGTLEAAGLEGTGNHPALSYHGGATPTIALRESGAALDAGDNSLIPSGITTDQRGPGFLRVIGGAVDIGAFERQATISVSSATPAEEGSASAPGAAAFTVALTASMPELVTVHYATADAVANGAKAGSDYVATSGTLTFYPGETTKTVTVPFIGDDVAERNERFYLEIETPANVLRTGGHGAAYIINDDGPSLTIDDAAAVVEGNTGTRQQVFTVHLSAASSQAVTVDWTTANNTAGPADFVAASGTLTFAPGQTSKLIVVQVKGDTTVEPTETYRINLAHPAYALIADAQAIGTITNDDVAAPLLFEDEAPSE